MKKTILICDRCEKETKALLYVYIPYDCTIHGVISHEFQLCPICAKKLIETSKSFYSKSMMKAVGDIGE